MRFPTITALVTVLATLVSGKCTGGAKWHNKQEALASLTQVCNYFTSNGTNPLFKQGAKRSKCIDAEGQKYVFEITFVGHVSRKLVPNHCIYGLAKDILNCGKGGEYEEHQWRFVSDPQDGHCST